MNGPRDRARSLYERLVCYLHQSIMPPVIILPPPKTRTSNKTTMAVPMTITTVLVFLVFVFYGRPPPLRLREWSSLACYARFGWPAYFCGSFSNALLHAALQR